MALAVTIIKQWQDSKKLWVQVKIVPSGSYVSGGDTLNLQSLGIKSAQAPFSWDLQSASGTAAQALNTYTYVPGTTMANGLMRAFIGGTAELAAGAYPAAATADNIGGTFVFEFNR
jgi:hypothetical protein